MEIKKCPFCGGESALFQHSCGSDISVFAKCLICDCQTKEIALEQGISFEQLKEKVKLIWNRRVDDGREESN